MHCFNSGSVRLAIACYSIFISNDVDDVFNRFEERLVVFEVAREDVDAVDAVAAGFEYGTVLFLFLF